MAQTDTTAALTRRSALRTLAGVTAAAAGSAVLAACGASAGTGGTAASGSSSSAASAPVSSASAPAASSSTATAASGGAAVTVSGGTGKQFVKVSGSTVTMTDRGDDCWGSADTCTFLNQKATGDGTWIVQVQSLDKTNDWAKAGIMARASLDQTSADVFLCVTPSNGVNLQYREHTGDNEGSTNPDNDQLQGAGTVAPIWLKLQKKGANWTAWMSSDGKNWTNQTAATQNPIDLGANFLVGLAATAHDNTQHGTAIFTGAQGFNGPFSADAVGTNDNA